MIYMLCVRVWLNDVVVCVYTYTTYCGFTSVIFCVCMCLVLCVLLDIMDEEDYDPDKVKGTAKGNAVINILSGEHKCCISTLPL